MATPILECVPNFSEGRRQEVIDKIAAALGSVEGARVLDVDPGKATNRTVMTLVGPPEAVVEAAFRAIREASLSIDMRNHRGEHARMGATDVCPLIPISGMSMDEAVYWSKVLAQKVGNELGIPVYLYEYSAREAYRRNLAEIRSGEYDILVQQKTCNKYRAGRKNQRDGVGGEMMVAQGNYPVAKPAVNQTVQEKTLNHIETSAGRITEGMQRHDPAERRVKEINQRYDAVSGHDRREGYLSTYRMPIPPQLPLNPLPRLLPNSKEGCQSSERFTGAFSNL